MRLLAIVADQSIAARVRHIAQCNPEIEWDCVTIRDDAAVQPTEWCERVHHMALRDRWLAEEPQEPHLPEHEHLQFERAALALELPMGAQWFHYSPALVYMADTLMAVLDTFPGDTYDAMVLWGEGGWYNEVAQWWARGNGLRVNGAPVVYVERGSFPGMLVVDGTGLQEGHCDLPLYERYEVAPETVQRWLSVATWQAIEPQRATTPGDVTRLLQGRETVFVPLQVPYDSNMIMRADGVHTNHGLLEWVAEHRAGKQVIVKKHPVDLFTSNEKLVAKCQELGFGWTDYAIHPLLEQVAEVVTINSQVGVEAWMHGVEVTWLGQPAFRLASVPAWRNLEILRFGYYVEPACFAERVRAILLRQKGGRA